VTNAIARRFAVIFCGFISLLIGRETINIPEIFSDVHGFMGMTVKRLTGNMENDEEYEHLASEFYYPEERLDEDSDEADSFPDNCVDWTNANVSFGPRNYECLSKKRSTFCSHGVQV